ncbi:hypothetical protein PF010_g13220 [Phytophthora fragariae]|uniref:SWIM-type domain-containing protein n=4 Tax=Phytophthora fragariae TaxID=53985 RepID=A0A6G0L0R0_9STRA|nr:hypothetical protein PF010_g13220 [Phytophthora fragariae]
MAEEAADTKRAVHQKGGGTAAAARAHTWPRRGPGISGALRGAQASSENDEMEDVELKEDHVETDGDGAQADRAGADTTSDAWSDAGDSQADSQALHIQGSGSPVEVAVEPPVVYHMSWEAWQSYLKSYCATTKQVLVVQETFSRAEQNKRLSKTKRGGDASQLVPEDLDPYSLEPGAYGIQVKDGRFVHNHEVSDASFATYPSSRGVVNPLVGARVEGMLAVGAKRSKIYDYLLEHDQNVIQVDVDNMVREHASSISMADDNDATAREIAAFSAADPENVSSVAETPAGETGVLSLATAHMRRIYGRFSELLLVDCSHMTNRYNYQLLTFTTMNEFGEGAVVQQSLLEANGDWHMDRAVAHIKRRMEKEYTYRLTRIGRFVNSSYDEEMSNVLRFTSPFVAESIEVEYSRAVANAGRYTFTVGGVNQVVIQGASKIHRLRLDNWTCDCEFGLAMKLPCRHAMAFRKRERGEGHIIPWMSIDVKWTNTSRSLQRVKQFTYEAYRKDGKKTRLAEKRTSAQRYRAAARATHLICTEMADIEDEDEFDELLEFLMTNWRNVRQRKMPTSSGADNTAMDASTASTRKNGGAKDDWQLAEDAKVEFDLSSGDSENVPDEDEMEEKEPIPGGVDIDLNEQAAPTIRLNPKARKEVVSAG